VTHRHLVSDQPPRALGTLFVDLSAYLQRWPSIRAKRWKCSAQCPGLCGTKEERIILSYTELNHLGGGVVEDSDALGQSLWVPWGPLMMTIRTTEEEPRYHDTAVILEASCRTELRRLCGWPVFAGVAPCAEVYDIG